MGYRGVIIEESLEDKSVLDEITILDTRVSQVTAGTKTPWLDHWTLHGVEIPEEKAESVARKISQSIDPAHQGSWFADFANDKWHYVIFRDRVFLINRRDRVQYDEAVQYGRSIGIPAHQLDFSKNLLL